MIWQILGLKFWQVWQILGLKFWQEIFLEGRRWEEIEERIAT
jgi:hypothetical protein